MIRIGVNPRSLDWLAVVAYVRARRAELVEEAIDLGRSDQERRDSAARIAELDELLDAPQVTRELTEAERRALEEQAKVY